MLKRLMILVLLGGGLLMGVMAQDANNLSTFTPRNARFTFDYPADWVANDGSNVITLADSESTLQANVAEPLEAGKFKIVLAYLTTAQRETANLSGDTPDEILASVSLGSDIPLDLDASRRYEFNRRIAVRGDFSTDDNDGAVWVLAMDNDAVILLQVFASMGELDKLDGAIIELLRSVDLTDITRQLYSIADLERPLQFTPQKTRLVFNYPQEWTVTEPNGITALLSSGNTQISIQFFNYNDLSLQGVPVDDPAAILDIQQARSSQPATFGQIQQTSVNGEVYPYSRVTGGNFTGLSLGRDFKVGFLWVVLLTPGDTVPEDQGALAWALLLTTQYLADAVDLSKRAIMPRHQFEFYYPADWLIDQVSPSSYLLGTSSQMIDNEPDNLLFTEDAQLLIQYVTSTEYGVARAGTSTASEVLQKFIANASDLTSYNNPRSITLGNFEFAQVDFDNPEYSGTALLAPMADGGAVWMQLRTPPNQLGTFEPVALEIAQSSGIVTAETTENTNSLGDTVFDVLGVQPTAIPTPTRPPDAPPDLGDVVQGVIATPAPINVRELNLELPAVEASYTTHISKFTANYPADWLIQETIPSTDNAPLYENAIRMANNPNLLLSSPESIAEGDVEVLAQVMSVREMVALGFVGDTLFERTQSLVNAFPQGTFDTPIPFRINGELMILVVSSTPTRRTITLYRQLDEQLQASVQLKINPRELDVWLPTAVAILQSVQVEPQ